MLPGPIFNVELLTSARRTRYFVVRSLYAAVLLLALWLVHLSWAGSFLHATADIHSVAQLSAAFFATFAWLQVSAVMLLGPSMVAGTIATERERRTIEYLFASRLSNAEIVLGKLAARLVHVVYLVLAGVPILAIMMLLGGIAPEALLALTVITLCTVLTVCTLSIAVSVRSLRARDAVMRTYRIGFVLLVLPLLLMALQTQPALSPYLAYIAPVNEQLTAANPFLILTQAIAEASGANRAAAADMIATFARNHLIASFLLAATATWSVRHRTHLKQRGKAAKPRRRSFRFFRPEVGQRPMLWKELFAEPAASRAGWAGRIATALAVLGVLALTGYVFWDTIVDKPYQSYRRGFEKYIYYSVTIGTILACCGFLMTASRAAASISSEKERDCWTSLLSTPLDAREIIWAKIAGSLWPLRGLAVLLAVIWGLGVLLEPTYLVAVLFMFGTFLLLSFFIAALGVRYSLRCRNSLRAMAATTATALLVGGGYLFVCMPLMVASRGGEGVMVLFAGCIPFLQAFPGMVYMAGDELFRSSREGGTMLFAYIVGTVGYCCAAFALTASSINSFDRLSGRTGPRTSSGDFQAVAAPAMVNEAATLRNS